MANIFRERRETGKGTIYSIVYIPEQNNHENGDE